MGTRFETPRPPDHNGNDERNIEFSYDPMDQAHVAWIEERQKDGHRTRRRISYLPDRATTSHENDIKTLMSWALPVDVTPRLPADHPSRAWAGRTYYPLPPTPMVLNLLKRMDYTDFHETHDKVRAMLHDLHSRGYKFYIHDAPKSTTPHLIMPANFSFCLVK